MTSTYTYRFSREHTETRTAFCPVCRVRIIEGQRDALDCFDWGGCSSAHNEQVFTTIWARVQEEENARYSAWMRQRVAESSTSIETSLQYAQDALLAAREGRGCPDA